MTRGSVVFISDDSSFFQVGREIGKLTRSRHLFTSIAVVQFEIIAKDRICSTSYARNAQCNAI